MDFNSEATMGKKPAELIASIIIEKVYNFLEADEDWAKKLMQGGAVTYAISRARLRTLYFASHNLLSRNMPKKDYDWLMAVCLSTDAHEVKVEDVLEGFGLIFQVLDKVGVWKVDTQKVYERHRVEEANKAHGY